MKEAGYECLLAKNGKEALRLLKDLKPDLIVLDIVMPVMDGMEALWRIIGKHKEVLIILYSSYPQYKEEYMSWAADACLLKFSDLTELKETIKNLLGKRKKSRHPREEVKKDEGTKRKKG